jgi:hypothetical protein
MVRKKLFISYSRKDVRWLDRVREHLRVLELENLIDPFDDTQIGAGEDWYARLDREMLEARIALLLISVSFLTSAFIRKEEIPRLFNKHKTGGMVLYPLLVRDCAWQEVSWLSSLQIRPTDARPIAPMRSAVRDKCLADVAREIASIVKADPRRQLHDEGELRKAVPIDGLQFEKVIAANQLFQIEPIQSSGENFYHLFPRMKGDLTEKFSVCVHFNFWTKHAVQMINVDLQYGTNSFPGRQTIILNGTQEALDESHRLRRHTEINAGAVLNVEIEREFESNFSDSQDYDALRLDFEIASLEWSGIRHLHATAKLAPGGKLENLKLKWNENGV